MSLYQNMMNFGIILVYNRKKAAFWGSSRARISFIFTWTLYIYDVEFPRKMTILCWTMTIKLVVFNKGAHHLRNPYKWAVSSLGNWWLSTRWFSRLKSFDFVMKIGEPERFWREYGGGVAAREGQCQSFRWRICIFHWRIFVFLWKNLDSIEESSFFIEESSVSTNFTKLTGPPDHGRAAANCESKPATW